HHLPSLLARPPRPPTLLPYTTLFRSKYRPTDSTNSLARNSEAPVTATMNSRTAARPMLMLDSQRMPFLTPVTTDTVKKGIRWLRSEEHTSELQSREKLVCRLLLEKKK